MKNCKYPGAARKPSPAPGRKKADGRPSVRIIGAGSIGQLTAEFLRRGGRFRVGFTDTRVAKARKAVCRCRLDSLGASRRCVRDVGPAPSARTADLVVITVKAYSVSGVIRDIRPHLRARTPVILMVNGFGVQDELARLTRTGRLYVAATANGAEHRGFSVRENGLGPTRAGPLRHARETPLVKYFVKSMPMGAYTDAIRGELLAKLAVNAVINPLTALKNCRNGGILAYPGLMADIAAEIAPVLERLGLKTTPAEIAERAAGVARATAANYSSTHRDYYGGKRTELDYILGVLIKTAAKYGIKTPYARYLYSTLKSQKESI